MVMSIKTSYGLDVSRDGKPQYAGVLVVNDAYLAIAIAEPTHIQNDAGMTRDGARSYLLSAVRQRTGAQLRRVILKDRRITDQENDPRAFPVEHVQEFEGHILVQVDFQKALPVLSSG
jgi:hypothetical protein